ncbi:MAG: hypothetical protein QM820_17400 [Minicystis sp.]
MTSRAPTTAPKAPPAPGKVAAPTISKADFEAELRRLRESHEQDVANERCIECTGCQRCKDCTFCKGSTALVRSHYCVDSQRCSDCTHCRGCKDLVSCNHCVASERCAQSAYLIRSVDCTGCTYCFGCVGLNKKDFHILNKPYDRSTYFAITARLARELGLG